MKTLPYIAAALVLAFAGMGCGRQQPTGVTPTPAPPVQAPADVTGVDAATDELINLAADEDKLIVDENNDAQEMGDDKDELNAITEASYDLP